MGLARSIVSRLRQYAGDRRHSNRQIVRLEFCIFIAAAGKNLNGSPRTKTLQGHTLDISFDGLALVVPTIRIGEYHLIGHNRGFRLSLELPVGPIEMQVMPVRYESLDGHQTESGFLIGAKIIEMPEADRVKFTEYLSTFLVRKR